MPVTINRIVRVASIDDVVPLERPRLRFTFDGRLRPEHAAAYLGYSVDTLANWRYERKGPAWVKIGRRVWYYKDALDAFVERRVHCAPTD